jgi:hypothetical protein
VLKELPNFRARPGVCEPHHTAQVMPVTPPLPYSPPPPFLLIDIGRGCAYPVCPPLVLLTWAVAARFQVNLPLTRSEWAASYAACKRGELPPHVWQELYFHTALDPSVASGPGRGLHTMSCFVQYIPHTFRDGDWDSRREEVWAIIEASLAQYCSNIPDAIVHKEVLGPPDIERKVGPC